jgi:hypothetical protein
VGKKQIILEYQADAATAQGLIDMTGGVVQYSRTDLDVSLVRSGQSCDQSKERGLTDTRGPEQNADLGSKCELDIETQLGVDPMNEADI